MKRYRRVRVPGASYFFTVVTAKRKPIFANEAAIDLLRDAIRSVMAEHPFTLDAVVILPDHLHALWELPDGDADFSTRWMLIKTTLTRRLHATGITGPIWQARYWEHLIRDETDFAAHAYYIHYNPVKHGYVAAPIDWPWSSFRRWVEIGRYPADWGEGVKLSDSVGKE